jgi:hypothetical protein
VKHDWWRRLSLGNRTVMGDDHGWDSYCGSIGCRHPH